MTSRLPEAISRHYRLGPHSLLWFFGFFFCLIVFPHAGNYLRKTHIFHLCRPQTLPNAPKLVEKMQEKWMNTEKVPIREIHFTLSCIWYYLFSGLEHMFGTYAKFWSMFFSCILIIRKLLHGELKFELYSHCCQITLVLLILPYIINKNAWLKVKIKV